MTFIAIIFSVPLTQGTVLNIDLGADSCGLHIAESGSIKSEERNYFNTFANASLQAKGFGSGSGVDRKPLACEDVANVKKI